MQKAPNIVGSVFTLRWASQHCWDSPNNVVVLPTLFRLSSTMLGLQKHCWGRHDIMPGLATLLESLSHCGEGRHIVAGDFPL